MKEKHKHHIIPRHIGGTDDPENIVELTIEEHSVAHRKLYEEHGRWEDMLAWKGLSGQIGKDELIQEMYKWRKGHLGIKHTGDLRRFGMANKGVKHTEEHNKKISESLMGHVQPQNQKDLVADANSMKWVVETPEGNKERVYNLNEFARKHNLGTAWQGNAIRNGHSLGYRVQRVSQTKSTATSGYRTRGKNLTL